MHTLSVLPAIVFHFRDKFSKYFSFFKCFKRYKSPLFQYIAYSDYRVSPTLLNLIDILISETLACSIKRQKFQRALSPNNHRFNIKLLNNINIILNIVFQRGIYMNL